MQNYTLDDVKSLIPPGIAAAAEALGDDWCHPHQLRMIHGWASEIVTPLTPKTDPEGHAANQQIDDGDEGLRHKWDEMIKCSIAVSGAADIESDKDHSALSYLVRIVGNDIRYNWEFYEAPKLIIGGG